MPVNAERADQAEIIEELEASIGRYRAVVIDVGVARLDARMLAAARPADPVLVVTRYGCTRRDELAATVAVIGMAQRNFGGVILNGYQSPAIDRLQRMAGLGANGR
jgi:Mrp family chromosome partitioning ATPase